MSAKSFIAYMLVALTLFTGSLAANAAGNDRIVGAWHTEATRAGSATRPVVFVFHSDGTLQYSSNTNIHTPATATPEVFFGRGGGLGVYHKVAGAPGTYKGYSEELLYDDVSNAKGRFLVEFDFVLKGTKTVTLSGEYKFRITSYTPAELGLSDAIDGEKEELADGGTLGQLSGYRLTDSCYFKNSKACHQGPTESAEP